MKKPRTAQEKADQRYEAKRRREAGHYRPAPVHRYNPYTDVACKEVGIPYGQVYIGCHGSDTRSHEMAGSYAALIPASQVNAELAERREWALQWAEKVVTG